MTIKSHGICTECGKEAELTFVTDEDRLCDECLDSSFTQCEECGEYYSDYVEFFVLKDGRLICEYCREEYEDEDIDFS